MQQKRRSPSNSPAVCYLHHGAGVASKTVAELGGLSTARVSRMLNGLERVNTRFRVGLVASTDAATAQRIIDAIPYEKKE